MTGLLKKDFLQLKLSMLINGLICLLALIGFGMARSTVGLICFFSINFTIQGLMTIQEDRTSGWYGYTSLFPISRQTAVRSKYLLALILFAAGFAIGLIMHFVLSALFSLDSFADAFWINILIALILFGCTGGLLPPMLYSMDSEKAILGVVISLIVPVALIYLWSQTITTTMLPGEVINGVQTMHAQMNLNLSLLGVIAAGCVVLFVVSVLVVPPLLAKKDQKL